MGSLNPVRRRCGIACRYDTAIALAPVSNNTQMNPSSSEEIRLEIMLRLAAVEKEHNIRILLAAESGSRARGL
ncbi:nucleotidyltransferase domain-containing protein [Oxalobacteraceae bacterium OTU3CAMAD1]|nr:nucleotidyltransferase domain-containing protein [Oxalobacteraceae bacterium OTU3CAMAD1]